MLEMAQGLDDDQVQLFLPVDNPFYMLKRNAPTTEVG